MRYDIIIKGFILSPPQPPFRGLMMAFGIDAPTAKRILAKFPCVVKRGVSLEEAQHFESALTTIGARVELQPEQPLPTPVVALPITVLQARATGQEPSPAAQRAPAPSPPRAVRPRADDGYRSARATEHMVQSVVAHTDSPTTGAARMMQTTAVEIQVPSAQRVSEAGPIRNQPTGAELLPQPKAALEVPSMAEKDFAATMLQLPEEVAVQLRFLAPSPNLNDAAPVTSGQSGVPDVHQHVPFDFPFDFPFDAPFSAPEPRQSVPALDDDVADLWGPLDLPAKSEIVPTKAGPPDLGAFDPDNFNLELALDSVALPPVAKPALALEPRTPRSVVAPPAERESAREIVVARGAQRWLTRPGVTPPVPDHELPKELQLQTPPYRLLACIASPIVAILAGGLSSSWLAAIVLGVGVALWVGWWLPGNQVAEGLRWLCSQSMYFSRTEADSPFDLEFVRTYERWTKHHGFELSRVIDLSRSGSVRTLAIFRHGELPLFLLLQLTGSRVQYDLWSVFDRGISLTTTDRSRERPVPDRHYVQNYPRAGLRTLWQRHLQTHDELVERLKLNPVGTLDFEPMFREACKEELELLETIPVWPLRVPFWQRSLSQKYDGVGVNLT